MTNNIILKATDIYKSYEIVGQKKTEVLKGLSLKINKGEFLALMGPSGTGKSTLLHCLGSLDNVNSGEIVLNINNKKYDYSKMKADEFDSFRNKNIGFIFQFHHLLPEFTALENVMMPGLISGDKYKDVKKRAYSLLKRVGLEEQLNQKPGELSGGEAQRVALARAIANKPAIVFADEPTGSLDKKMSSTVLNLIKELSEDFSTTFIIATHNSDVAKTAERILYLKDGKIA